jgi:hypothetical protein
MIEGLVRLMQSPDDVTGPLNIGNPEEFTMRELAETILDLTGAPSKIVHRPLPQDDPRQRRPDISRANALLGWAPHTPLRQGLGRTITYFEQLLAGADVCDIQLELSFHNMKLSLRTELAGRRFTRSRQRGRSDLTSCRRKLASAA